MKSVMALFGALIMAIVVVTFLTKGNIALGAGPLGPNFSVGFSGK